MQLSPSKSTKLLSEMQARGCTPSDVAYNTALKHVARVGTIDAAIDMLNQMEALGSTLGSSSSATYRPGPGHGHGHGHGQGAEWHSTRTRVTIPDQCSYNTVRLWLGLARLAYDRSR